MPRRRWLLVTTLLTTTLIVGVVCHWLAVPSDTITESNFNRIKPGMSQGEVEGILERKPDEVITVGDVELQRIWFGRDIHISLAFDDKGWW